MLNTVWKVAAVTNRREKVGSDPESVLIVRTKHFVQLKHIV